MATVIDTGRLLLRRFTTDDLDAFFHVNTDEGVPELALALARRLAGDWRGRVVRALITRTLIDVNRVVGGEVAAGMTAGLPPYLRGAADRELLLGLHARSNKFHKYQVAQQPATAGQAQHVICRAGPFKQAHTNQTLELLTKNIRQGQSKAAPETGV